MTSDLFASSDSNRHAQPLRYAKSAEFDEPLALERGGQLPRVTVAYETYGQLRPERDTFAARGFVVRGGECSTDLAGDLSGVEGVAGSWTAE